jgi:hypothetical protein
MGLRELNAIGQVGFSGVAEVLEFLVSQPTPEAIIALRPSEALQAQISGLLEKNRTVGLTAAEEQLWQGYEYLAWAEEAPRSTGSGERRDECTSRER